MLILGMCGSVLTNPGGYKALRNTLVSWVKSLLDCRHMLISTFSKGGYVQNIVGFPQPKLISFLAADALSQVFKYFMLLGTPVDEAIERSFLDTGTLSLCSPALIQGDSAKVLMFGGNPRFPFGIRPPVCCACGSSSNWTLRTSNAKPDGVFKPHLIFSCDQCSEQGLQPQTWSIRKPEEWVEVTHMPKTYNTYWTPFPAVDHRGEQGLMKNMGKESAAGGR